MASGRYDLRSVKNFLPDSTIAEDLSSGGEALVETEVDGFNGKKCIVPRLEATDKNVFCKSKLALLIKQPLIPRLKEYKHV